MSSTCLNTADRVVVQNSEQSHYLVQVLSRVATVRVVLTQCVYVYMYVCIYRVGQKNRTVFEIR